MKIYANQLPQNLTKALGKCYLLFGDEPFQINEARSLIKAKAKQAGFEEFIRLSDDEQFEWQDLIQHCQAMSLFSSTKLIELELSSNKIGKEGSEALKSIANELNDETVLVIFGGKLEAAQTKSAWFKALDKVGIYVPVYEIEGNHLQRWLTQQLSQKQLTMTPDAQSFLLTYTAGNLLACAQELDKLSLSLPNMGTLTIDHVKQQVSDQSRFTVFQLSDALWAQQIEKCITILSRLKTEEFEPNIILWSLQRDVSLIIQLQNALQYSEDAEDIFTQYRVWKSKQNSYLAAAQRLPRALLNEGLAQLSNLDKALKFETVNCAYTQLAHICMLFNGMAQLKMYSSPFELAHA